MPTSTVYSTPRAAHAILQPRHSPNTPISPSSFEPIVPRNRHHSHISSSENANSATALAPLRPSRSPARVKSLTTPKHSNGNTTAAAAAHEESIGNKVANAMMDRINKPPLAAMPEAVDLGQPSQLLSQVEEELASDLKCIEGFNTPTFSTPLNASTPSPGSPLSELRAMAMTPLIKTETETLNTSSSNTSYGDDSVILSREEKEAARVFVEEALEEELVLCLQPQDIAFFERDLSRYREPTNAEVRKIITAHFPYLKHPPPKLRNPHDPPSASLPPKATKAEQAARVASLVIGLEDVETRSVLKGQVVLESRLPSWKVVERLDASKIDPMEEVANLACMPNPWLLPIDAPSLLAAARGGTKVKRTFELPDFRVKATCTACRGAKLGHDEDTDDCFACEAKGTRARAACEFCDGAKKQVVCDGCNGAGVAIYAFTVEVKLRLLDLPPIKVSALIGDRVGVSCFEVRELARAKIMSIIDKICIDSARRSTPVIAVIASVTWEHSLVRTFSVTRPLHVKLLKAQRSQPVLNRSYSPDTPAFKPLSSRDAIETRYYAIPSFGSPWERKLRAGILFPPSTSASSTPSIEQASRPRNASLAGFFYPDSPDGSSTSSPSSNRSSSSNNSAQRMRRHSIASLFKRREMHTTMPMPELLDVQRIPIVAVSPGHAQA